MKRIALYGGSFDPPHLGHVITIAAVLNSKLVDEVWLVPTGTRPDKKHLASADDRKAMISIMLSTMFGSKVPVYLNTTQINRHWQISTTADLVNEFERLYPDYSFRFVIGSDLVADIPRWHNANKVMREGFFLMVQRLGCELDCDLPGYIVPVPIQDIALTNISSSLVRKMIAGGQSLEGVVPPAVISHILRNGRYAPAVTAEQNQRAVITEGRFIRFCSIDGWEFVERSNCTGVVFVVAVTEQGELLLTEQFRPPVNKKVIELPAGLVNDLNPRGGEKMEEAAARELFEETGYQAKQMTFLFEGPVSAGLTSEMATLFLAEGIVKAGKGEGDGSESIIVHNVPIDDAHNWLVGKRKEGFLVDPKIYTALFLIKNEIRH